jgi:hypothetical protein
MAAPMVFVVLAAFGLGCAFGIFAMVPSWWRTGAWREPHAARRRPSEAPRRSPASRPRTIRRAMDFDRSGCSGWRSASARRFVLGWLASRLDARQYRRERQDSPKVYYKG